MIKLSEEIRLKPVCDTLQLNEDICIELVEFGVIDPRGDIYGRSVKCKPSLSVAVVFCLFNFCCNLHINNSTV